MTLVIDLAHVYKWKVAHFRTVNVKRADGSHYFQTPVQADGAGFPDLVFARKPRVIFAELKSDKGKASQEQMDWLFELAGHEVYLWRPADFEEIQRILK